MVIGGQTLSLLLTLVVVPVACAIVDDCVEWVRARRSRTVIAGETA